MSAPDFTSAAGSAGDEAPTISISQPGNGGGILERPGEFIGPYRLMEQVGEGGFGTVWRAEQTRPVHREVALKVIKAGMDSREIVARFEAERQALALMDHSNIARMFDGGTTASGRPYFAMEFVKGEPVNAFCDSRKLSIEDRIAIFLDICSAVQHAHQKAILHRDLKPSNILVAESGGRVVPKVIDFGVAKALGPQLTDKTMFTAAGLAIGTPEYMSPEQAGAGNQDTDTRSDVYSLGVILYELLTGSTPLRRERSRKLMVHQLLEMLQTQDAERPSTRYQHLEEATRQQVAAARRMDSRHLQKNLRGDLDWVVMRALEKDRNRRYQTVNGLALDLQRYLKGDPVEAGPPSAGYRLGKMARRYRGPLVAASLVLASIFSGLGFTIWQAARATKAEHLASQRFKEAEQARDAAENLIDEAIYGLRKKLIPLGKLDAMEEMVAAADGYYRRLPAELYDDQAKRHLASLALNRATIAEALGQDEKHELHTREALRIAEELAARHPDDEKLQEEISLAMLSLCQLCMDRNDSDSLLLMADRTIAQCEAWLKKKPGSLWAMRCQVLAHNLAGQATVRYLRNLPEGAARFEAATQIARRMRELGGETADVCEAEGFIHYGNANVAGRSNRPDDELAEFEASTAAFARAIELGGDSALLREMHVGAMHHAGNLLRKRGRAAGNAVEEQRGEAQVRQACEVRRKLVELEPGRAEWWRDFAYSNRVLADIAREKGDLPAAIQSLKEDLRCRDEAVKRQPNRPQHRDERGTTCSILAGDLLKLDPPATREAAEFTLRSLEDWRAAVEMSGFSTLMRQETRYEIERLGKIAAADPAGGLTWLAGARRILEPLVGKVTGKNDLPVQFGKLLGYQRDILVKMGRTAEAKEVTAALESLASRRTPQQLHEAGKALRETALMAYEKIFSLPDAKRPPVVESVEAERLKAHALLEQAAAAEPANPEFRATLAASWALKGRIENQLKHSAESKAAFEKAFALIDPETQPALHSDVHLLAGEAARDAKDFPAAIRHCQLSTKERDERCARASASGGDFARASQPWSTLAHVQVLSGDLEGSLASLREAAKRRQRARELAPDYRGHFWDLLNTQLEIVVRLADCRQPIPPIDAAVPSFKELPGLLAEETDRARLNRYIDQPFSTVVNLLRSAKRLPEAAIVLRHQCALRLRAEALGGWPADLYRSSGRSRISLSEVLRQQGLNEEADRELKAAIADAERGGEPAAIADTHLFARGYYDGQGKSEDAERHARLAHEVALKHALGWRGIRIAAELSSSLIKLRRAAEAEKIALAAWDQSATNPWPDEPGRLRADVALRLCEAYHALHLDAPDATRDASARVWIQRAAEAAPLDQQKSEGDFNSAMLHWLAWLGQLAEEGRVEEYRRHRTAMLAATRAFSSLSPRTRASKAALILPAEGDELKQAVDDAAAAFRANPSDEWTRLGQCLALVRAGKAKECLETAQPMLKTADTPRWCCIQAIVALAHRRLGQHAEADAILATIKKDTARAGHFSSPTHRDAIIARVLVKEAKQK